MSLMTHFVDLPRWKYLWKGATRRVYQKKKCPCCGSSESVTIDHKLVYRLEQCRGCRIRYRYPYERAEEMCQYYQDEYNEPGLTTEQPTPDQLRHLTESNFAGSEKDFSQVVAILHDLGLRRRARVLDFGANWGYCTFQLRRAGFDAEGYEISKPRAEFARKLGVHVMTDLGQVGTGYDAVYSSHVLEHMSNPLDALRAQLRLTREGGFVIAHTPNGSEAFMRANFSQLHRLWGLPHPVLLNDHFITTNLSMYPCFIAESFNRGNAPELTRWDQRESLVGDLAHQPELLIIIRNKHSL
jgi:2-polyprenyl-3-methyl-5-hydroxy-6-metoxy-1,4-benzoquinol methylase